MSDLVIHEASCEECYQQIAVYLPPGERLGPELCSVCTVAALSGLDTFLRWCLT